MVYKHKIKIEKIKNLPDRPGVYIFKDGNGEILYIGKASSLRDRVKSYFGKNLFLSRSPLIEKMVAEAENLSFRKTDSVLEALILEAKLIKKYQPKYNTQEKDDRSFNYVVITKEDFPRVLLERGKNLSLDPKPHTLMASFGPFPHGSQLKQALKIVRKIFPFRDQKTKNFHGERFYQELGLAPKIQGREAKKEYRRIIHHLKLFFQGKKKQLIKEIEKEMVAESKKQNFEKAGELRNKIFALKHIQDVSLIKTELDSYETTNPKHNDIMIYHCVKEREFRIETYDIAHMMGKFVVGAMVVMENGELKKSDYRKFKIKKEPGINDPAALKEIIKRRLNHREWPLPDLVSVDGGIIQKNAGGEAVQESGFNIPVVSVVKDEKHKPRQILGPKEIIEKYKRELLLLNQEAHRFAVEYHKILRGKIR